MRGLDVSGSCVEKPTTLLRQGLQTLGLDTLRSQSPIVPIVLGETDRALACAAHLEASGIFAPAIAPVDSAFRLPLVLSFRPAIAGAFARSNRAGLFARARR